MQKRLTRNAISFEPKNPGLVVLEKSLKKKLSKIKSLTFPRARTFCVKKFERIRV